MRTDRPLLPLRAERASFRRTPRKPSYSSARDPHPANRSPRKEFLTPEGPPWVRRVLAAISQI